MKPVWLLLCEPRITTAAPDKAQVMPENLSTPFIFLKLGMVSIFMIITKTHVHIGPTCITMIAVRAEL